MRESAYQAKLIQELKHRFPGCTVLKNDSSYLQGIPDLIILYGPHWAVLEVKRSADEPFQPNQEYYLEQLGNSSFAACIYPENEEAVLNELSQSFQFGWDARLLEPEQEFLG